MINKYVYPMSRPSPTIKRGFGIIKHLFDQFFISLADRRSYVYGIYILGAGCNPLDSLNALRSLNAKREGGKAI
jgi:hypothetical protein